MDDEAQITLLLERAHDGDQEALDEVGRFVHADLVRQAKRLLSRREASSGRPISLEPAEIVNEAFLKLLRQRTHYKNREHFFAIATTLMLRVLMDHHKARRRLKRGGDQIRVSLSGLEPAQAARPSAEITDLVAAFETLERHDHRIAQVAKLRALWGLSLDEISGVLAVSRSTVDRDWRFARTWLAANL